MVFDLDTRIRVRMFGKVKKASGYWYKERAVSSHIIVYCIDGCATFAIKGITFKLCEGDMLVIPQGTPYRPLDAKDFLYYFMHFDAITLHEEEKGTVNIAALPHTWLTDGYAHTYDGDYRTTADIPYLTKSLPYEIRVLFERAKSCKPNEHPTDIFLLDNLAREILIRASSVTNSPHSRQISQILAYIHDHYAKKMSLSVLSAHFQLSESYIARLFKKNLSMKPSEYVNRVRISVAQKMLVETNLSVTEIAETVGFSDVYYFSKVFKRTVGKTPISARKGE